MIINVERNYIFACIEFKKRQEAYEKALKDANLANIITMEENAKLRQAFKAKRTSEYEYYVPSSEKEWRKHCKIFTKEKQDIFEYFGFTDEEATK